MNVGIVGTGYVGLVTGTCLADLGNTVICFDQDQEKINTLLGHKTPFFEPELQEKILKNTKEKRLFFSIHFEELLEKSDIVFIAVGTPSLENGNSDLSSIWDVVKKIAKYQKGHEKHKIMVIKSTVPVGTAKKINQYLSDQEIIKRTPLISNPEFLREGHAIYDFFHPDRIVLGSESTEALNALSLLYDPLHRIDVPIVQTSHETAELSKYASNAFLATKISFINEMACLCDKLGADVGMISKIMGMDRRIGKFFLHPGPGYGGSCFPKDIQALIHLSEEISYDLKIPKAVNAVNQHQKKQAFLKLKEAFPKNLHEKKIAILGLSFKPETDDIRQSSAMALIEDLIDVKSDVVVTDPEALENTKKRFGNAIKYADNAYDAAVNADAMVILTEWHVFRELDLRKLIKSMRDSVFLDFRNLYKPEELKKAGFRHCYVIGKPEVNA